jgi:hypothetical protein
LGENESRDRLDQGNIERAFGLVVGREIVVFIGDIDQDVVHFRKPKGFRPRRCRGKCHEIPGAPARAHR